MHIGFSGGHQTAAAVVVIARFDNFKRYTGEFSVRVRERFRHMKVDDGDTFVLRVFLFPRARFHFIEAGTHNHLNNLAAQSARGTAAIHRGVSAAQHDHAFADFLDVAERHR